MTIVYGRSVRIQIRSTRCHENIVSHEIEVSRVSHVVNINLERLSTWINIISVYASRWSIDCTKIAVGSASVVNIITATTGVVVQSLTGATAQVTSVVWSPDGTKII